MKPLFYSTLILLTTLLLSSSTQAEVYKWVDEQGRTHYSDQKPEHLKVDRIKIKPHKRAHDKSHDQTNTTNNDVEKTATRYKKKQKVTMYATSWCGYCKKARAYFKKNKISFSEYDIEKNPSAKTRYEKLGGTGIPLLVAKRKTMQGFSAAKFKRWYENL